MDPRVRALAEGDEPDGLMAELQAELRRGNAAVATDLARLFRDTGAGVTARSASAPERRRMRMHASWPRSTWARTHGISPSTSTA